jgi:hypothetical protein
MNIVLAAQIIGLILAAITAISIGYKIAIWRNNYVRNDTCHQYRAGLKAKIDEIDSKVDTVVTTSAYIKGKIESMT